MVGPAYSVFVLADTATNVQRFVDVFIWVYILLIFAYILTSWIRMPYSLHRVQRFLDDVCEPYIRIFRRILPTVGPLDLSPIVAVVALYAIRRILDELIGRLL
jgi:YggT family protein